MKVKDLLELREEIQARDDRLYQSGFDRGILTGISQVKTYIENQREPLLRKILSGNVITQEEDVRLTVYSEVIFELERLKGDEQ